MTVSETTPMVLVEDRHTMAPDQSSWLRLDLGLAVGDPPEGQPGEAGTDRAGGAAGCGEDDRSAEAAGGVGVLHWMSFPEMWPGLMPAYCLLAGRRQADTTDLGSGLECGGYAPFQDLIRICTDRIRCA